MRFDLSDEEWAVIEPLLPTGGAARSVAMTGEGFSGLAGWAGIAFGGRRR